MTLEDPESANQPADNITRTEEAPLEIKGFTPEVRKKLERAGFRVYSLTEQSIRSERDAGKSFSGLGHSLFPAFEILTSRWSEVAIKPDQLFLPMSNKKTLAQQEHMVEAYSQELQRELRTTGIKAIIGEAADYVDLAFTHPTRRDERLFGKRHNFNFARTRTPLREGVPELAVVGNFGDLGLNILSGAADKPHVNVWAVPLVEPAT